MLASILHRGIYMMIAMLTIKVLPGKRKAAIDILRSMEGPLRVKKELVLQKIYQADQEEDEILYMEQWLTKEALQRHIQSDLFMRILEVMELSAVSPQLSFQEFSGTRGIDLVIALREG
jgi:quinol monooxygenase YgiN